MPILPFPSPIRWAAAFRLCSCSLLVAEVEPGEADKFVVAASGIARESDAESGRAKVADVEVKVVGGVGILVGVEDDIDTVAGRRLGEGAITLLAFPVDPTPPPCRCRGL